MFTVAKKKQLQLFTSSHALATTYYILNKFVDDKKLREILLGLLEYLSIIPIDADILAKGLRSSNKDFEDAVQIICASMIEKMDCIVTRNIKDFKESTLPVYTPDEFFLKLQSIINKT